MLYGWKENSMLTNCLAACAHLNITFLRYSDILVENRQFFHTPLHSTPPLGGSCQNSATPFGMEKTRMAWLPDGEKISKISLFVLAQLTNVTVGRTDGQTDGWTPGDGIYRAYA